MSWSNSGFPIHLAEIGEFSPLLWVSKSQKLNDKNCWAEGAYSIMIGSKVEQTLAHSKDSASILVLASISCLYVYPSKKWPFFRVGKSGRKMYVKHTVREIIEF